MWDELRSQSEIDADIYQQAISVAHTLNVPEGRVFALSAQKALQKRIAKNPILEEKSRIKELEIALSQEVLPARRAIVLNVLCVLLMNSLPVHNPCQRVW